ncbi:MAG: ComEC/Rec2 family competence protein [Candidatus Jorgensenbacteria bacterium]|nr:ComEC/Rec2 family competence protein [Candidatus Jorgensenbacteria bacterium]
MRLYDAFFFGALLFLGGILAASLPAGQAGAGPPAGGASVAWWVAVGGIVLMLAAWYREEHGWQWKRWASDGWLVMAALLFFLPAGALYYRIDHVAFSRGSLPENAGPLRAEVVSHPVTREGVQETILALEGSGLRILARFPVYPALSYGDNIEFTGRVEEPFSDSYRAYLAKERVRGVIAFPKLVAHEPLTSFSFRGALYTLRDTIVDSFRRTLPAKEAALMAGLTVGAREDFSEEFRDAMAKSGTTHLVALSGYNISILVLVAMSLFLLVFSQRAAFVATLATILAFVLMTGAEASVVRAAVMGGIALLARQAGRVYSMRNAIIFAALVMVIINPKVLAFDLGFQLSFLALLGIVYLKPALDWFVHGKAHGSVFSWRENLTTTASAQLAVAPLLIHTFGSVSISALAANILVLEVVPLTMGLGFILAAVSFLSFFLAKLLGLVAFVFLKLQTLVIEWFAFLAIPVGPTVSVATALLYYGVLIVFVWYVNTRLIPRRV